MYEEVNVKWLKMSMKRLGKCRIFQKVSKIEGMAGFIGDQA
jgi:hypothetical protein